MPNDKDKKDKDEATPNVLPTDPPKNPPPEDE